MSELIETIPFHRPMNISIDFSDIFESGILTKGKYITELEAKIKKMYNVEYAIATSSGTQGLLIACNYGKPHSIQLPAFNWYSDLYVLKLLGIEPCFNDISIATWLMEEDYLEKSLYVHTFGNVGTSEYDNTIYDATHAFGCMFPDIGLATVFSFAATKIITSCEGGMIITNDKAFAEYAIELRDKNCRMSELHAKVGLHTLAFLDKVMAFKHRVYEYYRDHILGLFQEKEYDHNYNTIGFLNTVGLTIPVEIKTKQYYKPLKKGLFNTDYVFEHIICLPSWWGVDYKLITDKILEANKL